MKNVTKHRGRLVIRKRIKKSLNGNPRFSIFISRHDRDGRLLSPGIAGLTGQRSVRSMMERYPHLDSDAATKLCEPLNAGLEATFCLTTVDSSIAYVVEALASGNRWNYDSMYVEAHIGTHYGIRQLDSINVLLSLPRWDDQQYTEYPYPKKLASQLPI
jgi:hypothetical protein